MSSPQSIHETVKSSQSVSEQGSFKSKGNDPEMPSSQFIYETVKGFHEFKIEGYSVAKGTGVGKFKTSGKFKVGGHDWVVHFYPDGDVRTNVAIISLFVELVDPGEEVRASFELKLLDQTGNGKHYCHKKLKMKERILGCTDSDTETRTRHDTDADTSEVSK
ncbi:hypothetical protein MKW94_005644, partial [Papaver nudicaule]|nr:hypothetical protein [Papaver nudicaule]